MKQFKLAFVALTAIALASCSSDEPAPAQGNGGNITFSVKLPMQQVQGRAFSDGQLATSLTYAVYESDGNNGYSKVEVQTPITQAAQWTVQADGTIDTNVPITLTTGRDYRIVFWAADTTQTFTSVTYGDTNVTLNCDYANVTDNSEVYDAFYKAIDVHVSNGYQGEDVILYRPFAQLNVGSNDTNLNVVKASYKNGVQTKVTVSNLANQMDLLNNQIIAPATPTPHTFGPVVPAANENFPVVETPAYSWLAMNYLLVQDASDYTVGLEFLNGSTSSVNTLSIPNVPLQRNYQTNIFGQLLSTTANYNVKIQPAFTKQVNIDYTKWYCGLPAQPTVDQTAKEIGIASPAQLNYAFNALADPTAVGLPSDLSSYTMKIESDIDMQGSELPALDSYSGTIDGQGNTIENFEVNSPSGKVTAFVNTLEAGGVIENLEIANATYDGNWVGGALVGHLYGTVRNCKVTNCNFTAGHYVAAIAGWLENPCVIEGCEVKDCTITAIKTNVEDGDKVGALGGYSGSGIGGIRNNKVINCTIRGMRNVAGLVGQLRYATITGPGAQITGNLVENCIIGPVLDAQGQPVPGAQTTDFQVFITWAANDATLLEPSLGNQSINNHVYPN